MGEVKAKREKAPPYRKGELSGREYGKLTVLGVDRICGHQRISPKDRVWVCKCECGKYRTVTRQYLLYSSYGHACSCRPCAAKKVALTASALRRQWRDLMSHRFGLLTVLQPVSTYGYKNLTSSQKWQCLCDCGKRVVRTAKHLLSASRRDRQPSCLSCGYSRLCSVCGKRFIGHYTQSKCSANCKQKRERSRGRARYVNAKQLDVGMQFHDIRSKLTQALDSLQGDCK